MERRRAPRRHWVVGRNDLGRATLERSVGPRDLRRLDDEDPLATTYDFLKKLDVPGLALDEPAGPTRRTEGFDPYDTGIYLPRRKRT